MSREPSLGDSRHEAELLPGHRFTLRDLSSRPSAESREVSEEVCWTTITKAIWLGSTSTMPVGNWICPKSSQATFPCRQMLKRDVTNPADRKGCLKFSGYCKLDPTPLEEFIFFDHPSGRARIRMAMDRKAANLPAGESASLGKDANCPVKKRPQLPDGKYAWRVLPVSFGVFRPIRQDTNR